MGGLD